jgi:hypothetical protein
MFDARVAAEDRVARGDARHADAFEQPYRRRVARIGDRGAHDSTPQAERSKLQQAALGGWGRPARPWARKTPWHANDRTMRAIGRSTTRRESA